MKLIPRLPDISFRIPQKSLLKYGLLGIFFYFAFLIINVPAEWLAWGLNKYSHGTATLTQAGGSIWKGRGLLSLSHNRGHPVNLGQIEWDIYTFWLLIGQIDVTLDLSGKGLHGHTRLVVSPGGLTLSELRASILANNLGSLYSPASLISPLGRINVNSDEISINNKGVHGKAEGKWLDAGSALSTVKPLGNYNLTLTGKGKNAKIVLKTSANSALNLAGKGNWTLVNGLINFNGTATPVTNKSELESVLSLMGRDIGAGKRLLRFNTRIPFSYKINNNS